MALAKCCPLSAALEADLLGHPWTNISLQFKYASLEWTHLFQLDIIRERKRSEKEERKQHEK
jgi:hypothetical protein